METTCRSYHSGKGLSLDPGCINWLKRAVEHCRAAIKAETKFDLWKLISKIATGISGLLFSEQSTGLATLGGQDGINPEELCTDDCHVLVLDVHEAYMFQVPRYTAHLAICNLLWKGIHSMTTLVTLVALCFATSRAYRKFGKLVSRQLETRDAVFAPVRCMLACAKHDLRKVRFELRRLHVVRVVQPVGFFTEVEPSVMVLRIITKVKLVPEGIICEEHSMARMYGLRELIARGTIIQKDYRVEPTAKSLKYINSFSYKLQITLDYDDIPDELLRAVGALPGPLQSTPPGQQVTKVGSPSAGSPGAVSPRLISPRKQTKIPHAVGRQSPGSARVSSPVILSPKPSSPRSPTKIPSPKFVRRTTTSLNTKK